MHGRGYVNDGQKRAANYIGDRLKEYGVDPLFEGGYFQAFEVDVNAFPGAMSLIWDGDSLEPGIGFIPDPSSGNSKGSYQTFKITPPMLESSKGVQRIRRFGEDGGRVAVLDPQKAKGDSAKNFLSLRYALAQKGPVIVLGGEDLTWAVSDTSFRHAMLEVDSNRIEVENGTEVRMEVENRFKRNYSVQNVGGIIEGTDPDADTILLSGHYDQLGRMGKDTYIPGASDNGSGTSMLLHFAEKFAQDPPERTIVLLFFAAEELGLLGSKHYVGNPAFPLERIRFQVNLDIVGGGSEGITAVNGKVHEKELELLRKINEEEGSPFPKIKARGKAANSDHHWFSERGVPAFFIYTLGDVDAYHDVHDTAENLPFSRFEELSLLVERFVREL